MASSIYVADIESAESRVKLLKVSSSRWTDRFGPKTVVSQYWWPILTLHNSFDSLRIDIWIYLSTSK